jgi:hypothetical protein
VEKVFESLMDNALDKVMDKAVKFFFLKIPFRTSNDCLDAQWPVS